MRDERLGQNEIRYTGKKQHDAIKRDRPRRIVVLANPSCGEGRERKPEQQVEISPEDRSGNTFRRVQEVVMIVPVDADVNETEDVTQEDGNHRPKRFKRRPGRHPEVQDHDRYDDREDAVAEGFETALVHLPEPVCCCGRFSRMASATSSFLSSAARSHFAASAAAE